MPELFLVESGERRRRCTAKCRNAQGSRCRCVCGGKNHGQARQIQEKLDARQVSISEAIARYYAAQGQGR